MAESIIFDMDGTLWDSSKNVAASWNEILSEICEKQLTAADIKSVMGLTMDKIAARFFGELPEPRRMELLDRCGRNENDYLRAHGGEIYPNTANTLKTLAEDFRLFIVSNCQAGYIEAFLDFYELGSLISDHLCWGDNNLQKADNIRLIMERNNAGKSLYVGDTQTDCDSAYSAGAKFAFAAYGFGSADRYDLRLNDISELPQLVKNM